MNSFDKYTFTNFLHFFVFGKITASLDHCPSSCFVIPTNILLPKLYQAYVVSCCLSLILKKLKVYSLSLVWLHICVISQMKCVIETRVSGTKEN